MANIASLRKLEIVSPVSANGLAPLSKLRQLRELTLGGDNIDDASLRQLARIENLESLKLVNTSVTDAGLLHLERLTKLRQLDPAGSKVTLSGLERIRRALPSLSIIYVVPP